MYKNQAGRCWEKDCLNASLISYVAARYVWSSFGFAGAGLMIAHERRAGVSVVIGETAVAIRASHDGS
jgi:hypothetical protein